MTSPRPVSRRAATTAALWSAPVLLAASAAPAAAASGVSTSSLAITSGSLSNGGADLYQGQFTPVVRAAGDSEPVRDILARVTLSTGDGVVLSDFVLEDGPWVVVEELGSRTRGVFVLAWSDATGLSDGESPIVPRFSFRSSGYINSCLVSLTSTSASATQGNLDIAVV